MNTYFNPNISQRPWTADQELIVHLMVITHFVQKATKERLTRELGYDKLSLSYEGYFTRLAQRDYSPGELAAALGTSKQLCSRVVKELEKLGLVTRRRNPEDSRSSVLSLSEAGTQLLRDGMRVTTDLYGQFAANVGSERMQQLIEILELLCDRLQLELPAYRALERVDGVNPADHPTRLNVALPRLNAYFQDALLQSLTDKGFAGLKPNFGQVLGLIRPEGGRIQHIASVIGVSKQAIAVTISDLEQLGYITREADPEDGRQHILHLSPTGRQLVDESAASVDALGASLRQQLEPEQSRFLDDILNTLYRQVAEHYDTGAALSARIQQLSDHLLAELGAEGAHALAQKLITLTRGTQ